MVLHSYIAQSARTVGLCWRNLKIGITQPILIAGPVVPNYMCLAPNWDVSGNNIDVSYASSVSDCASRCDMNPLCTFFVFLTDGRCAVKKDYNNGPLGVTGSNKLYVVVSCFKLPSYSQGTP